VPSGVVADVEIAHVGGELALGSARLNGRYSTHTLSAILISYADGMNSEQEIRDVAASVRQAAGNLARRLRQTRGDGGLSWRESSALSHLARLGPATSAELARLEGISPQSMGATLQALETAGLIARSVDPGDGRRVVLSITDAGQRYYEGRVDGKIEQIRAALSEGFSPEELKQLAAAAPLLDRLADHIHTQAHHSAAPSVRPAPSIPADLLERS
jgi:DNA-binding MarR family transcriptional regulator